MTRRNLYHAPRSSLGRSPKLPPAKRLRGNGTPAADGILYHAPGVRLIGVPSYLPRLGAIEIRKKL